MFGLLECDHYIGDIIIPWIVQSRSCSIHFTVTLTGLKNVKRSNGNNVTLKITVLGLHCKKTCCFQILNVIIVKVNKLNHDAWSTNFDDHWKSMTFKHQFFCIIIHYSLKAPKNLLFRHFAIA